MFQYLNIPMFKYLNIPISKYLNIQIFYYHNIPKFQYYNNSILQYLSIWKHQYYNYNKVGSFLEIYSNIVINLMNINDIFTQQQLSRFTLSATLVSFSSSFLDSQVYYDYGVLPLPIPYTPLPHILRYLMILFQMIIISATRSHEIAVFAETTHKLYPQPTAVQLFSLLMFSCNVIPHQNSPFH